jgi:putative chitobiose transport system substrate-binding protein
MRRLESNRLTVWLWPLVLGAAAAWLSACGGRESGSAQATPDPRRTERIEFWTLALAPFEGYLRERIAAFEAAHPTAKVAWIDVPFDAVDRKLTAAAAAGRAPDVINLSDRTFARYAGLGAMADLRPLLKPGAEADYLPGALAIGRMGDRLLALPWYLTTQIGMVNTGLLQAGGLDPQSLATDWTSLRVQALAYHQRTGKRLFSLPLGEESQLPILMWAEGLRPLKAGPDGRVVSNLRDPAITAYVRSWVELYRSGALPPEAATRDHAHLTEMYQNGELALIDSGPNFLKRVQQVAPSVYAQTVARPPVHGASGKSHIATMVVSVTRQSRHPKLAAALAAFMTSPESQTAFCKLAPILPSTPASLKDAMFARPAAGADGKIAPDDKVAWARAVAAESLADAVAFTPAMEAWPDLRKAFEEGMKRMLLDGRDVEAEMSAIDAAWNRMLAESPAAGEECLPRVPGAAREAER